MKMAQSKRPSQFLEPTLKTEPNALAIISLARDQFQPVTLDASAGSVDGYVEGAVLNTRFGSYPHSTLLDIPWGSQVRASRVDTGSRGRKRRREGAEEDTPVGSQNEDDEKSSKGNKVSAASTGFIYILRPTPELWTSSLPHRTQVVYTPDYSYILHRIRARPGTRIIEAGAGSGSFTHASARAVYNGYPSDDQDRRGKVFSFEFHEPRFHKMQEEVKEHSLDGVVQVTHRDVYKKGFLVDGKSPSATAVFLDLPAPWQALRHLSRRRTTTDAEEDEDASSWTSPLDPKQTVHICTFSPCIEQVSRTVTELRTLGWVDVDMVEIAHKRINVTRERVGVNLPNERGYTQTPADVTEAVDKLKASITKTKEFHRSQMLAATEDDATRSAIDSRNEMDIDKPEKKSGNNVRTADEKPWMCGKLLHRPEAELKTHTSYLVFAVLPREWSEEDEAAALAKWPCGNERKMIGNVDKQVRKQERRELLQSKHEKRRKLEKDRQATDQVQTNE